MNLTGLQTSPLTFAGTEVNILVSTMQTRGAFSLMHLRNPPGCWTPPHRHRNEDETFFILSGSIQTQTEDGIMDLLPGQVVTLPRGHTHRMGNVGHEDAQLLVLCAPGGFDEFVRAAGQPFATGGDVAVTGADLYRLVQEAPCHGVELLGPEALPPVTAADASAAGKLVTLDVFGAGIQFLAELGAGEDGISLMRGQLPPHVVVPLHSHMDREVLYVLEGTLDISLGPVGQATWQTVEAGRLVDVAEGVPHALRNRGDRPVDIFLVTTRRIADLFRELGLPAASMPPGPPSPERLAAFAQASSARGMWLADYQENAAIGLLLG